MSLRELVMHIDVATYLLSNANSKCYLDEAMRHLEKAVKAISKGPIVVGESIEGEPVRECQIVCKDFLDKVLTMERFVSAFPEIKEYRERLNKE